MKPYIAVMEWDADNRVTKFQDFEAKPDALSHVTNHLANYPRAFVVLKPNDSFSSWLIDGLNKLVTIDFPVIVPPTDEERIDSAFPANDTAQVIFETLFELNAQVIELKGGAVIDRTEFRRRMQSKLI